MSRMYSVSHVGEKQYCLKVYKNLCFFIYCQLILRVMFKLFYHSRDRVNSRVNASRRIYVLYVTQYKYKSYKQYLTFGDLVENNFPFSNKSNDKKTQLPLTHPALEAQTTSVVVYLLLQKLVVKLFNSSCFYIGSYVDGSSTTTTSRPRRKITRRTVPYHCLVSRFPYE